MAILTYTQQQAIKPISTNKERVFLQLEKDVEDLYLPRLFSTELAQEIQKQSGWDGVAPDPWLGGSELTGTMLYGDLLNGSTFDYCGKTLTHKGLRYVLAYYLYAEYVQVSDFEDTFTGLVRQNRGETEHLSSGRIEKVRQFNISIAQTAFETMQKYIHANRSGCNVTDKRVVTPRFITI